MRERETRKVRSMPPVWERDPYLIGPRERERERLNDAADLAKK